VWVPYHRKPDRIPEKQPDRPLPRTTQKIALLGLSFCWRWFGGWGDRTPRQNNLIAGFSPDDRSKGFPQRISCWFLAIESDRLAEVGRNL
jgi:hypothetical protein